jgi:hypothetical protein
MRGFLSVATMLASAPAFAFTYPGANCEKESGGTRNIDTSGHAENTGTTDMHLVCPLVIDDPTAVAIVPFATVYVTDYNAAPALCCDSRVKYVGNSYVAGADVCTPGNFQQGGYTSVSPAMPSNANVAASRYLFCDIPAVSTAVGGGTSELRAYLFNE